MTTGVCEGGWKSLSQIMTAIDELWCCLEQAYLLDLVDVVTPGVFMDGQKRMCHTLMDYV